MADSLSSVDEDTTIYTVVVNDEEQYSIWPAHRELPRGWRDAGRTGSKPDCLAYIETVWTDMRPLSLRRAMEGDEQAATEIRRLWPDSPDLLLSDFARFYLMPIDEIATHASLTLDKPYGINYILVPEGAFGLSCARLLPGQGSSLHYHRQRREFFRVRTGRLTLTRGAEREVLDAGASAHSTPLEAHSIANESDDVLEILEIFAPAILDDKVRVDDRYRRKLGDVGHLG